MPRCTHPEDVWCADCPADEAEGDNWCDVPLWDEAAG